MEKRLKNKGKRGPAVLSVLIATMLAVTLFAALPADGSGSSRESRTLGDAGDYHPDDVAVINSMIENNGLYWTPDDPKSWPTGWDGVLWNDASPKRITELYVAYMNLTGAPDMSGLTSLVLLVLTGNKLTSLDVSGMTSLELLYCYSNKLTSLDVSGATSLKILNCESNYLTELDLSGLTSLEQLTCNDNRLTSLDVSGLTSLTELACNDNRLTSLDVSGMTSLTALSCDVNYLTELNVSGATSLEQLFCEDNRLTSLNVSGLNQLVSLSCDKNLIEDKSKVAVIGSYPIYFYFGTQFELIEITDSMSEAEISKAINDVVKGGVYDPLVTGTVTSNTGTLAINNNGNIHWRAAYTGGTLELNGNGEFFVGRDGSITVDKMLIKGGGRVAMVWNETISVNGDLKIEDMFSSLSLIRGKVTVGGDLIAEGTASNDYAVFLSSGELTIHGDVISSGILFYGGGGGIVTVGGNAISGGDYALYSGPDIHIKGDVISLNGYGLLIFAGNVKIDGTLTVKDGEPYIINENTGDVYGIGDNAYENTNGYALTYTDDASWWHVYIGYVGNGNENGTDGDGDGSDVGGTGDGSGTDTDSNGAGESEDDVGSGTGSSTSDSSSSSSGPSRTVVILITVIIAGIALSLMTVRRN